MKIKTDYAAHIAAFFLAVLMGAGSVALAGGSLVDGRSDGPGWREARAKAAHPLTSEVHASKAGAAHPG